MHIDKFLKKLKLQILPLFLKNLPKFQTASLDGLFVLLPHSVFVLLIDCLTVIDVVQPQVNTQRDGLQPFVEDLDIVKQQKK